MYRHFTSYLPEIQLASLTASLPVKFNIPTIDKLTLLADFRHFEKNVQELSKHNDFLDTIPDRSMHYDRRIRTASDLFIQVAPMSNKVIPNLRIEFNPNKFDYRGSLWHTLYPMLRNKRFTRIDYAIDYQQDLSQYQWQTEKPRSGNIYHSSTNKTETVYLGCRTSSNQYRIYNKSAEQKSQGMEPSHSVHWRIEQQFKLSTKTEFWMLRPFSDLVGWKPDTFTGDYIDDLVLSDLHEIQSNWARLSSSRYRHYRKLIKDSSRVQHMPLKPQTIFEQGKTPLEAFLKELLS